MDLVSGAGGEVAGKLLGGGWLSPFCREDDQGVEGVEDSTGRTPDTVC